MKRDHIASLPFVTVGPELVLRLEREQRRSDADSIARLQNRSLDEGIDAQCASNLGKRSLHSFEDPRGRTRDHPKGAHFAQCCRQLLGHSVAEVFLSWVSREVLERQHGQRVDRSRVPATEELTPQTADAESQRYRVNR